MSGISTTGVPLPPSAQQAAQISQGIKNPGQHANQISSATPPANFSQGRRFFITENNGAYKLDIVNTGGGSSGTGGSTSQAAFDPSGDALEVNASIAWAITTNQLNAGTYYAQQEALKFSANNVITQVGASPLQTPSLAGDITGDQFDAAAILAFLKKNKASNDDSNTKADVSTIQANQASALLISDLSTQLANYSHYQDLVASNQQAETTDTGQALLDDKNNVTTYTQDSNDALTNAQKDAAELIGHYSKSGAATIAADLQKLNKQQLTKLVSTLSNSVLQSISGTIDKNILAGIPLGQGHHSKTLDTNDGTVVKTPEQETQDAIVDQLESEDFHTQLTQSIIDNAQSLGLGDLSPSDLQSLASSLATVTADTIADDPQVISDAINNSSALQSDITTILQLELEGQSGRSNTPSNV